MRVESIISETAERSVVLVDEDYKIVEEVSLFLRDLKSKDYPINTIETYCRCLKEFYSWLKIENLKFYEVRVKMIFSYIKYLDEEVGRGKRKAPSTINRYLATLSSFYRYFETMQGYLELIEDIEIPNSIRPKKFKKSLYNHKASPKQINFGYFRRKDIDKGNSKRLVSNQIENLYNIIETNDNLGIGDRNRLLFKLLYETGLRIGEALGLRLNDFSPPDVTEEFGYISVVKRTGNDSYHPDHAAKTVGRLIPVSMDLIFEIDNYVCNFRPQKGDIASIFVNHRGATAGSFMTRRPVESFFNELSSNTGIKCTPHMLRHTHATELSEAGYNTLYIQDRLGHASIQTTSNYTHLSLESQTIAYGRYLKNRKGAMLP